MAKLCGARHQCPPRKYMCMMYYTKSTVTILAVFSGVLGAYVDFRAGRGRPALHWEVAYPLTAAAPFQTNCTAIAWVRNPIVILILILIIILIALDGGGYIFGLRAGFFFW